MKVVEGGFKKKEAPKSSEVLREIADAVEMLEKEGEKADVVVVIQKMNSPALVLSSTEIDRTSVLLDFAKNDVMSGIYYEDYITEWEDDDDTIH
jgi:predicted glycosyltransferase